MINFLLRPGNFSGVFAVKLEGGNTYVEGVQPFGLHTCSIYTIFFSYIHKPKSINRNGEGIMCRAVPFHFQIEVTLLG